MPVKVKKLFLLAVCLKIGFSALGWFFAEPWFFGLVLPLTVMAAYIGFGLARKKNDVSDDKFADSCYYLGFIFTISSIIFGLFDLPQVGTKMSEIAVRFGAAMMSTVLGLVVRVYLVSFRTDLTDAMNSAESGVIGATQRLREQLAIALDRMREFDARIDEATQTSIARVAVGVDKLTEAQDEKINAFCAALLAQSKSAFDQVLGDVDTASQRLSASIDAYATTVSQRMEGITFPEDYFAKRLEAPVAKLGASAEAAAAKLAGIAEGVTEALGDIRPTLSEVRSRADEITDTLGRIIDLATVQADIVSGTQTQVDTLAQLATTLKTVQEDIAKVAEATSAQTSSIALHANSARAQNAGLLTSTKELSAIRQAMILNNAGVSAIHRALTEMQSQSAAPIATLNSTLQKMADKLDALATSAALTRADSRPLPDSAARRVITTSAATAAARPAAAAPRTGSAP
jgi:type I site-specific restriction endonuclease